MKNTVKYIIGIILALSGGLLVGYICPRGRGKANDGQADTTTVIHYDTIRTIPDFISSKQVGVSIYPIKQVPALLTISDTVKTPYFIHDTLIIPIEQKYYAGENYKAWISGYSPKLDSLLIYQQTKTVTIEKTRQYKAELSLNGDMRMYSYMAISAGLEAELKVKGYGFVLGTGAMATPSGWKWYGMAGIKYNLFTKKW